ncbi:hypothetical protein [Thalassospira sp. UBA1131]|uniref:hypothetical protein n=1 Tax=Thalassospira sp. UBA1131 TaxID=1947672 RepID=UPI0025F0BD91|nr:hypothetical protein [Thalassospira sp. UBA1131]
MFKIEDLVEIVKSEADYHRELSQRLQHEGGDRSQFYKHQHLSMAMAEVCKLLQAQSDGSTVNSTGNAAQSSFGAKDISEAPFAPKSENIQSLQEEILSYLENVEQFNGVDPFDLNLPEVNRLDALIVYLMSDGRQRNGKAIKAEVERILSDESFDDAMISRRVYSLDHKKGILEKQSMRGYYKIKSKYSKKSISEEKSGVFS